MKIRLDDLITLFITTAAVFIIQLMGNAFFLIGSHGNYINTNPLGDLKGILFFMAFLLTIIVFPVLFYFRGRSYWHIFITVFLSEIASLCLLGLVGFLLHQTSVNQFLVAEATEGDNPGLGFFFIAILFFLGLQAIYYFAVIGLSLFGKALQKKS